MASLQQQVVPWSVDDGSAVADTSLSSFGNTVRRRDSAHRDQCRRRSRILKKRPSVLFIHSDLASIRASSYRRDCAILYHGALSTSIPYRYTAGSVPTAKDPSRARAHSTGPVALK